MVRRERKFGITHGEGNQWCVIKKGGGRREKRKGQRKSEEKERKREKREKWNMEWKRGKEKKPMRREWWQSKAEMRRGINNRCTWLTLSFVSPSWSSAGEGSVMFSVCVIVVVVSDITWPRCCVWFFVVVVVLFNFSSTRAFWCYWCWRCRWVEVLGSVVVAWGGRGMTQLPSRRLRHCKRQYRKRSDSRRSLRLCSCLILPLRN